MPKTQDHTCAHRVPEASAGGSAAVSMATVGDTAPTGAASSPSRPKGSRSKGFSPVYARKKGGEMETEVR